MRFLGLILIFFLLSNSFVFAQVDTSDFVVRQTIFGVDNTPPTTPTLLTIDPVASTQIDITWSVSTDDYFLGGYSILRDGIPIATTTLNNYSDTGLTPSTTYSYEVRAFDTSFNYSTTSNSLSTTTLSSTPGPTTTPPSEGGSSGGSGGTVARVVAEEIVVDAGFSTSSFYIRTARPARFEIRWGRTTSYELGYVVNSVYQSEYRTLITDLEPRTTYEYEIIGYTPRGIPTVLEQGQFTTKSISEQFAPANVQLFTATQDQDDVQLQWQLPSSEPDGTVRIVRSHLGFPSHPQEGAIIYEGKGTSAIDQNILLQYSPVYYTAFLYDETGNVSSGAIAIVYATARKVLPSEENQDRPPLYPVNEANTFPRDESKLPAAATTTPSDTIERVVPDMLLPSVSDIKIIQDSGEYTFFDNELILRSDLAFLISIPRSTIAPNLKSIIVTLTDPTDSRKTYSFLLRINKDQTAYEAVVAPLGVAGAARLMIDIYDFEAYVVGMYQKPVLFVEDSRDRIQSRDFDFNQQVIWWALLLFAAGAVLLLFWFLFGRRRSDKDEDK